MRIEQLGTGTPEIAIVGAIHGDEPCGVRAIERLLAEAPPVDRPVALVVANERAFEANQRYIDHDLNRAFDPDIDTDSHEYGVAQTLAETLRGTTALALHSTQSYDAPFGFVKSMTDPAVTLMSQLSIEALVDLSPLEEGRLFAVEADFIEVEAGRQGTEQAAQQAYEIAREFLAATGAIDGQTADPNRTVPSFRIGDPIEKPPGDRYTVFAKNFRRVDIGEAFAAVDGTDLVADEPFYPILLSAEGYDSIFGYRGVRIEPEPAATE